MFMIGELGDGFMSANFPDNGFSIPRPSDKMVIIDEINGRYCTAMFEEDDRGTYLIKRIYFAISAPYDHKDSSSLPVDSGWENIFVEDVDRGDFI